VRRAATFVNRVCSVLGLVPAASDRLSAFNVADDAGGASGAEAWGPFVDAFTAFREQVPLESLTVTFLVCMRSDGRLGPLCGRVHCLLRAGEECEETESDGTTLSKFR